MTPPNEIIEAICSILQEKKPASLPASRLREWLAHENAEVRGAAYHALRDAPMSVDPPLTRDEYVALALEFFERTIRETEMGDWAFSGYQVAWDFASWFSAVALDTSTPRTLLNSIVERLGILEVGTHADYDFIAHARQDISHLVDEVRRLKALLNNRG